MARRPKRVIARYIPRKPAFSLQCGLPRPRRFHEQNPMVELVSYVKALHLSRRFHVTREFTS